VPCPKPAPWSSCQTTSEAPHPISQPSAAAVVLEMVESHENVPLEPAKVGGKVGEAVVAANLAEVGAKVMVSIVSLMQMTAASSQCPQSDTSRPLCEQFSSHDSVPSQASPSSMIG